MTYEPCHPVGKCRCCDNLRAVNARPAPRREPHGAWKRLAEHWSELAVGRWSAVAMLHTNGKWAWEIRRGEMLITFETVSPGGFFDLDARARHTLEEAQLAAEDWIRDQGHVFLAAVDP